MLQADEPFAGINGLSGDVKKNRDGFIDVYFAPGAVKGCETNWIQTISGRSRFIILRMYGPLEPWRPGLLS